MSFALLTNNGSFIENGKKPVAYIPSFKTVLIAEPDQNRIGIYDSNRLKFRSWLQHPSTANGHQFQLPSSFLHLRNGHFFILEENQINILNGNFAPYQEPLIGKFLTLSQGNNDEVVTKQLLGGSEEKSNEITIERKIVRINRKCYGW